MSLAFNFSPKATRMLQDILQVNIEFYREQKQRTKAKLSREIGYSDSYLGKIERGEKIPSLIVLCRLSQVLDIPIDNFFQLNIPCRLESLEPLEHQDDCSTGSLLDSLKTMCGLETDALLLATKNGDIEHLELFSPEAKDYFDRQSSRNRIDDIVSSFRLKSWFKEHVEKLFHLDMNWTDLPVLHIEEKPLSFRYLFGVRLDVDDSHSLDNTEHGSIIGIHLGD